MKDQYLFVYGTLRKDFGSDRYPLLARYASLAGEGCFQGRLYRIDYYPGAIPSDDSAHQVKGEVYGLHEPEFVLSQLDRYEECGPEFNEPTEYRREKHEVTLLNGRKVIAWVYIYNRPVENFPLISSGDFLNAEALADKQDVVDGQ